MHELIPSVLTCILSKQLCLRPESDNHWALRDFATKIISQICKAFNTSVNNIQCRITRLFSDALSNESSYLPTIYGAVQGISYFKINNTYQILIFIYLLITILY